MTLDKQAHFFAGAAIASVVALYLNPLAGLVVGILAGALKEVRDRAGFGTPDSKDFLTTALGATVVLPALLL